MGVSAVLKFTTAPLSDMISWKSTYPPYSLGFMSSYCANVGISAFQYGGKVLHISMISSHSEEPVANFNIVNLNKMRKNFCQTKKLVLTSICKLLL